LKSGHNKMLGYRFDCTVYISTVYRQVFTVFYQQSFGRLLTERVSRGILPSYLVFA
jgi:hypothetical protein